MTNPKLLNIAAILSAATVAVSAPSLSFAQTTTEDRERLIAEQDAQDDRAAAAADQPGLPIENSAGPIPTDEFCFDINNINIEGVESLASDLVANLIDPYLQSCMGQLAVDHILQTITQAYLDVGLITSRAYLPGQDLTTGTLTIVVVEGIIEDVVFAKIEDGQPTPGDKKRFDAAFPTKPGELLNLRDLEQGVDQMNRVPSQQAQLDIAPGQGIGGSVIQVAYGEQDTVRLTFGLETDSTENGFSQSASFGLDVDNVLGINDTLYVGISGSDTSNTLSTRYTWPAGYKTWTVQATYSEALSQLTATSELFEPSLTTKVGLTWLTYRDDKEKHFYEFDLSTSDNWRYVNGSSLTPQKFRDFRLGMMREYFGDGTYTKIGGGLKFGRQISATSPDIDNNYAILDGSFVRQNALDSGHSLYTSVAAQYSPKALWSSQKMSIGGTGSLRGISGSSASGDIGLQLSSELTLSQDFLSLGQDAAQAAIPQTLSGYSFLDFGIVRDHASSESHMGLGIGVGAKYRIGRMNANISIGIPIAGWGDIHSSGPEISLSLSAKVF